MNKQSTAYIHDTRHYINLDIFEKRPHIHSRKFVQS